ncbi:AraC family transcriptional regulator [Clostridium sp. DJ247]|uniref:AraC family transcriptional regulator n=1 Tax=Clostridium sp. DJ247 TaxID=2726188 RepID=UPI00162788F5|nr:AraC family transcriptional regulator [Clostridium sp. DJ247]MBC2581627.1 AraC family transcriptional regulator [Clostridium sp. DJ247]
MIEESSSLNSKRGYLQEDFIFFHLKDKNQPEFELHYHDFNKIIIFISGKVTYLVEGKAYDLRPWDILFVNKNEIHKPIIDLNVDYERIILWVNSRFLKNYSSNNCNLQSCFEITYKQKYNLLRLNSNFTRSIKYTTFKLEDASKSNEFGSQILKNSLFLQLMVYLNRLVLGCEYIEQHNEARYDKNINDIINYINENLSGDLSLDTISEQFYVSKYYLMHKFKKQTGCTIHSYITQKRIIMANNLVKKGKNITEACVECGFGDYSSFIRAFKKLFGMAPKQYYRNILEIEKQYDEDI